MRILFALWLVTSAYASTPQEDQLQQALSVVEEVDRRADGVFGLQGKDIRGIEISPLTHPIGDMRFNLQTRKIEVFQNAFTRGPEFLAAALAHEIRHADFPTHAACPVAGPLRGIEGCDEVLPAWDSWRDGGSYVYELAFQKLAIEAKIPGHQRYVRQFIGNLHIRFARRPTLEVLDQWIGPDLAREHAAFIAQVRAAYYR